jgi:teichuronic acid exporter
VNENNRYKIFSNMGWKFGSSIATQFTHAIVSIVLARMILPESYGVMAIVLIVIAFCGVFVDFGLGSALVQKKNPKQEDYSSVFYINIIISLIVYIGLFFLAPIIAKFYEKGYANLTEYIRIIGVTLILLGINSVQNAYVAKNLLFKKAFAISFLAGAVSGITGIVLAYTLPQGERIWALIVQNVLSSVLVTAGMWFYIGWRPKLIFSKEAIKPLFDYGWKILLKGVLNLLSTDIRKLVIGKVYAPGDLAFYDRGRQYPLTIAKTVDNSISTVLFPVLSNAQDNVDTLKKRVRRTLQVCTYLTFPMLAGFAIVSQKFVVVLLTEAWIPAVPFLQIFCIAFLFRPLTGIQFRSLLALGRSDITLKCEVIRGIADAAVLAVTVWFGVLWIAVGVLFTVFIEFLLYYLPNKKLINYTLSELFYDVKFTLILTLIMSVVVLAVGLLPVEPWILLILQVVAGIIIYFTLSYLTKNRNFLYLSEIIKHTFSKIDMPK